MKEEKLRTLIKNLREDFLLNSDKYTPEEYTAVCEFFGFACFPKTSDSVRKEIGKLLKGD